MLHEIAPKKYLNQENSVTFFLMTEKGFNFLKVMSKKYRPLFNLVVVGSDKAITKDFEDEIINFCDKEKIRCIKKSEFSGIKTKYALAISWRWLINHSPENLIIFHDSLLPKYRGFAPLVNALINEEKEIGVTALFGANDYDTGAVITQFKSKISYPIKIYDAIQINHENYLKCADFVLKSLLKGEILKASEQVESESSYSVWRDEEDYKIDWSKKAGEIRRFIDAVGFPYSGASTIYDGKLIRIITAEESADLKIENRDPGKVIFLRNGEPFIICGEGILKITEAYIEENGIRSPFLPLSKYRVRFSNA